MSNGLHISTTTKKFRNHVGQVLYSLTIDYVWIKTYVNLCLLYPLRWLVMQ